MDNIGIVEIVIAIVSLVVAAAITFYIKDWYQKRRDYNQLIEKINKIAGKGAKVIYAVPGIGSDLYKIESIDSSGIFLKSEVQSIFLPIKKVLESEIILPADDYLHQKKEKMKKDFEEVADTIFPVMFDKMFPPMLEAIQTNFIDKLEPGGEIDAIIGVRITKALKDHGLEIKQIESKDKK